jgi:type II secretory pathway component PulK
LAVLVVLVLLSLAAYNYSDLMVSEYKVTDKFSQLAQARAYADSGIHFAMAALASPDTISSLLGNNPYNNAGVFRNHAVGGDSPGFFTLVAPQYTSDGGATGQVQYGVIDESSKININAVMVADPTGKKLNTMLMLLPNMTSEIAASIVNWMLPASATPISGGATSDYYNGLSPPYNAKGGPVESLEELLLVQGVTPQFLFGSDANRNNYQDVGEDTSDTTTTGFDRGWSAFLTVYSREQNIDASGLPLTNLNDSTIGLDVLFDTLSTNLGEDLATFIIMYRQLGGSSGGSNNSSGGNSNNMQGQSSNNQSNNSNNSKTMTQTGTAGYTLDFTKTAKQQVKSLYDLVGATVSVQTTTGTGRTQQTITTVYKSPLSDTSQQAELLAKLFQTTTVFAATEIPARVNMNTAPQEVLTALGLSTADVQAIAQAQPQYGSGDGTDDSFQTPAWLISQANVNPSTLSSLEPYITTRSQVYRVQSLGYVDANKGTVARVEAVIDINPMSVSGAYQSQPRILSWREMNEFGRVRPPQ